MTTVTISVRITTSPQGRPRPLTPATVARVRELQARIARETDPARARRRAARGDRPAAGADVKEGRA